MIRNDFVSNSSSCSFVISNPKVLAERDQIFYLFNVMRLIPNNQRSSCDNGSIIFKTNEKFCDNISQKIKTLPESSKLKLSLDDDYIEIKDTSIFDTFRNPSEISDLEKDIIIEILENSSEIEFNLGLDDMGTKGTLGAAMITALYLRYNIEIGYCDSDNFGAEDILDMIKPLK